MARTIAEWKVIILAKKAELAELAGLTSTSDAAEHKLWVDIMAFVAHYLDGLFDAFKTDVDAKIAVDKAHTLQWYVTKAKAFQYGVSLPADTDVYAVVPPVDEAVLIVTSAAAVEVGLFNKVRIKAAKGAVGALEALTSGERGALAAYMQRIKDAGVRIEVTSGAADDLKLDLTVYYDPLVLDADGARLDGTDDEPVKGAINNYLSSLPFDGVFILNDMIDAIESVEGVKIGYVVSAEANYGATPYVAIPVKYTPDAGYLVLNDVFFDGNVSYLPG